MNRVKLLILSFVIGFVLLFIQQTIFNNFLSLEVVPNLLLIFCIYLTLVVPQSIVNILVFILGLFIDSNTALLLGPSSFSFLLIYIALTKLSQRIVLNSFFSVMIVSFISSLIYSLIYLLILFQLLTDFNYSYLSIVLEAIFTGILSPFLFFIFGLIINKNNFSD